MLISTLRLAGHTVSLVSNDPPGPGGAAPPVDGALPIDAALTDGSVQSGDAVLFDDAALPDDAVPPNDAALPNDAELTDDFTPAGDTPLPYDAASLGDYAELPDDAAPPYDIALPDVAAPGEAAQPDETSPADSPFTRIDVLRLNDPSLSAAADGFPRQAVGVEEPLSRPPAGPAVLRLGVEPALSIQPADRVQYLSLEAEPSQISSDAHVTPAPGGAGIMPAAASLAGGEPPVLSIALDGDSADPRPPAPGVQLYSSRPGAGSFSDPPSDGGAGDGGCGGGCGHSTGTAVGPPAPDGQSPGADDRLSVDVALIRGQEIQIDVLQTAVAAIAAKVDERISDFRHEMYVSRAAWNALFPRRHCPKLRPNRHVRAARAALVFRERLVRLFQESWMLTQSDWEPILRMALEETNEAINRLVEGFASKLKTWLDQLLNSPIPEDWQGELAAFVSARPTRTILRSRRTRLPRLSN